MDGTATTTLTTVEDLLRLPEDARCELIRGEIRPMSPVGRPHSRVLFRVGSPLTTHVEEHNLGTVYGGDIGVVLERDPDTVLAPDIAFVRGQSVPLADEEQGYLLRPPDLVVEIASPSDTPRELRQKIARYFAAGVPAAWLIEARPRTVTVALADGRERVLTEADVLDGGDIVPGFRLPVADIFR